MKNATTLLPEYEVRQRLGMSRTTWWRLLKAGGAPDSFQLGTRRMYDPEAVQDWLNGKRTPRAA